MGRVELGCGLISIGRPWGTTPEVPSEANAINFLQDAYDQGIRFFDTAPSYGLSEQRLGAFLDTLSDDERAGVTIATKFGEHWDTTSQTAYADHSYEALKRSLEQSIYYLGRIAILQLHKTMPELLHNADVVKAFEYARSLGIKSLGASVGDPESAHLVLLDNRLPVMQLPYNQSSMQFQEVIKTARSHDTRLIINRPFQMGSLVADNTNKQVMATEAFRLILQEDFDGVTLTGTSTTEHLRENIAAFETANQ